jgi:hypothetical protein
VGRPWGRLSRTAWTPRCPDALPQARAVLADRRHLAAALLVATGASVHRRRDVDK